MIAISTSPILLLYDKTEENNLRTITIRPYLDRFSGCSRASQQLLRLLPERLARPPIAFYRISVPTPAALR